VIENHREAVQGSRRLKPQSDMVQKHRSIRKGEGIQMQGRQSFLPEVLSELQRQDRLAGTCRPGDPRGAAIQPPGQERLRRRGVRVSSSQGQPYLRPAVLQELGL